MLAPPTDLALVSTVSELRLEVASLRRDLQAALEALRKRDVEQERLVAALAAVTQERDELREEKKTFLAELGTLRARVSSLEIDCAVKDRTILRLAHEAADLRQQLFGRSSEKEGPQGQEAQTGGAQEDSTEQEGESSSPTVEGSGDEAGGGQESGKGRGKGKGRREHGRKPLPPHLPRERIPVHPPGEKRVCPCCGEPMRVMEGAEEVTERLHWVPASLMVRQFVRFKYSCATCEEAGVVIGDLPPAPIEKGRPTAELLAHVITSKYCDHLPLYRQEEILARQGIAINRSTLSGWMGTSAFMLRPVVAEVISDLLKGDVIRADETGMKVLDRADPANIRSARMWAYRRGPGEVVLVHTRTKANDTPGGPKELLEAYRGFLQADAANGFDCLYKDGRIVEVGCHAHSRRRYKKAKDAGTPEAGWVLEIYQGLYQIEAEAKERGLNAEERLALRQERARPLIERLYAQLDRWKEEETFLPRSLMGKAISYSLNHREALCRYLEDGRLEIDNNDTERVFRIVALGRHNYLFCGSEAGAHAASIHYSLVQGCRELGIDPCLFLSDVLDKIATGFPMRRIGELTPKGWKAARDLEAQASARPDVAERPPPDG